MTDPSTLSWFYHIRHNCGDNRYGYEFYCEQMPRLREILYATYNDEHTSVLSEETVYMVDGKFRFGRIEDALEVLKRPAALTEHEQKAAALLPDKFEPHESWEAMVHAAFGSDPKNRDDIYCRPGTPYGDARFAIEGVMKKGCFDSMHVERPPANALEQLGYEAGDALPTEWLIKRRATP